MPLYKIVHANEKRLIKAASQASALRHATTPMFVVTAITDPSDAAEIAAGGVKLEVAGEIMDGPAAGVAPTAEAAAEGAMLADLLGGKGAAGKPHAAKDAE